MLNTGNLLGSLAAPSSATGLVNNPNPAQSTQSTTPAAQNYYQVGGANTPAGSTGQTVSPNLTGLIPLTPPNPNADAINSALKLALNAHNTGGSTGNTTGGGSVSTAGSGLPGSTNSMGTQILTADQLTAQNGGVANLPQTSSQNNNGSTGATTASGGTTQTPTGLVGGLIGTAQGNIPIGQTAQQIGQNYGQQIANVGNLGAGMVAGDLSTGTNAIGEGNAAIASNAASSRINALGTAEQAALAGTGQQLTAQNQAQTGLGTAAGLIPSPLLYGAFGSGLGSNLDPQTALNNAAQQLATGGGSVGYTTLYNQLSSAYGAAVANQLLPTIQASNPSFNVAASDAQATATGSNVQALGTAGTSGEAAVLQSIPALTSANTAAQGIANTISSFIAQNPQLNVSSAALGNAAQQWLQGKQLADPTYQTFFNDLSEYTNTLAPILGVGGDPTNLKTQIAQGFINAQASGQSINQVIKNIGDLATQKVQNLASGAAGGGVVASGTQNGNTTGSSLYSF